MSLKLTKLRENKTELVDSLYLVALQGMNQLLPLLVMPYLMVVLGAGRYGYIGFSLSVVQYFTLVVDFGFNLSATKHIALVKGKPDLLRKVFWAVFWAKVGLMAGTFLVMLLLVTTIPTFRTYGEAIFYTYPMVIGSAFTFMWMFQGIGKVRVIAVINTVSKLVLLPAIFFLVKSADDYLMAALLQALVFVLTAVISCAVLYRMHVVGKVCFIKKDIVRELKESFPLFLSSASTSVYTQLFVVILGFVCVSEVVGCYSSAERIMRALCFLFYLPISQSFYPKISALSATDRQKGIACFSQVKVLMLVCMLVVSVTLFVLAPLVRAWLGEGYERLSFLLRIMACAPVFIGLGGVYGQMGLVALGNRISRNHFRDVYFIVALVSLTLVAVLAPWGKDAGAALALLVSEILVFILMFYHSRKDLRAC